jgi:rhamnose transport system substrate-binding protein
VTRACGLPMIVAVVLVAGCTKTTPGLSETPSGGPVKGAGAKPAPGPGGGKAAGGKITVVVVPKIKGNEYFNACDQGAQEAGKELGTVEVIYDGPTEDKVDDQIRIIDGYIAQKVAAIAVSPNDPDSISPVLKKARDKGIHVLTWDADASPQKSGREFFINQASNEAVGKALVDEMAAQKGAQAKVAIITASLTAANQNAWIAEMKKQMAAKYPGMKMVCDPKPSEENAQIAFQAAQDLMKTYPDLDGIFAISSNAFPGAADAVQQAQKGGKIAVVGLATPKKMKQWVDSGAVKTVILWNPVDLGYLAVQAAKALVDGKLPKGATKLAAGRLGEVQVSGDQVLLGPPMKFTRDNIGKFDF